MPANKTRFIHLLAILALASFFLLNVWSSANNRDMLAAAYKDKSDILFLKGKFILKDKKGSIVISDEKKSCHCPHHYYRR